MCSSISICALKKYSVCVVVSVFLLFGSCCVVKAGIVRKIKRSYNVKVGEVFDVIFEVDWQSGRYFDPATVYNDKILKLESQRFVPAGFKGHKKPSQVLSFKALSRGQTRALYVCRFKRLYHQKVLNTPSYRVTVNVK